MKFYTVMGATTRFVSAFYSKVILFRNIAQVRVKPSSVATESAETLEVCLKNGDKYELTFKLIKKDDPDR